MIKTFTTTLLVILTALTSAVSQGTIRGIIYDDATGETVPFANVLVQETQSGTTSDLDGAYALSLDAGTYTIEFSFLGYSAMTVSDIVVMTDGTNVLDIRLKEESALLDEIVVTATQIRNTESAVLTIQKKSPNLLDGISSQTFRKIGDSNAAAAIKRVTGVSVQGGKYVFVRGLGDRYTKSILNGMDIPGLDPDRNTLQMDIFPTNLIDNILVVKSFTPNLPGDFTGGIVDIITKDFPETKTLNISGGIGYNPNMHLNDQYIAGPSSGTDFLGFDSGRRDLPLAKAQDIPTPGQRSPALPALTQTFSNEWAGDRKANLPNFNFGLSGGNQINKEDVTFGFNYALNYRSETEYFSDVQYNQWLKPNLSENFQLDADRVQQGEQSSHNTLLTGLVGGAIKFKNHKISLSLLRINNGEAKAGKFVSEALISSSNVIQRDNIEYGQRAISNALLKGKHSFDEGNLEVEWKLSPTISQIEDKDVRVAPFRVEGGTFTIEPSEGAVPQRIWRGLEETNYAGKLDITKKLLIGERDAKVSVGGGYTTKNRDYEILNYTFDVRRGARLDFSGDANEILLPQNIWTPESGQGVFAIGNFEPANTFDATQNILGVYAMNELPIGDNLKAVYGLRVENFVHRYTGQNNDGTRVLDDEELLNTWNILPAMNLIYALNDESNLRASFSQTLANPSFKELSLAEIYDAISNRRFIGNLDLVQSSIQNYDLRWERYISGGQMFALSGFYKRFSNPIELVAFSEAAPEDVTPRNVGDASVLGVEIELRKNLEFVSASLANFSLGSNVTIVKSEVQMDRSTGGEFESRQRSARVGETIEDTRTMQGQSPYIINTYLNYNDSKTGLEGNLSYNVQGRRLSVVGIAANPDVYEQPFNSLNFKLSKALGEENKFRVSVSAQNLLNAKRLREYESFGADNQIYDQFIPGTAFSVGLNYRLF